MDEAVHQKRLTDTRLVDKINEMIETEESVVNRAQLLIQLQIANLLIDNVTSVRVIAEELRLHREDYDEHVAAQDKVMNRSWGVWKATAVLYFILQGVIGWLIVDTVTEYRVIRDTVKAHAIKIEQLERERARP